MPADTDVIVVGGGISGLTAAFELQQHGLSVLLLETQARVGGTIGSERVQGFLIESGPNSVLESSSQLGHLLDELNLGGKRIDADPAGRNRFIVRHARLTAAPLSAAEFLSTPLLSAAAKLRLLCEPFIRRSTRGDEESVADFMRRRLGAEFVDYAIDPFIAGVYAGDAATLSMAAAFPRLHAMEQKYGSLTLGAMRGRQKSAPGQAKPSHRIFSFSEGMQTLTDTLAARIGRIETSTRVCRIVPGAARHTVVATRGESACEFQARAVVLATPAYAAAELTASFASQTAAALAAIQYPPVTVAVSAYPRAAVAHPLNGYGYLVPRCENRQVLGTLFSSTLFSNRAPNDTVMLTTFIGGMRQPELAALDDAAISRLVQAEHAAMLGVRGAATFMHIRRWRRAIPQYTPGHATRIAQVEATERQHPGLFFCCNYRGGVAVGDCVDAAAQCAAKIEAFLGGNRGLDANQSRPFG